VMALIDSGTKWVSVQVEGAMPAGPLRSLLTSGLIAGVGGVLKFLPQILILFAFIAVLEDCGYMARAAFLMDRIMSRCGMSGKSFIPLLSSVACAVPGIMATRVIENRRDRFATILVAPLISCSARIPVYALMIGLFLPRQEYSAWSRGLMMFGMYMVGFIAAPVVAVVLRKTLLRGERSLFVMELPAYKRPSPIMIARRVYDAGWSFVYRAGTVILATMVLVWASLYFPYTSPEGYNYDERAEALSDVAKSSDDDVREKLGDQPDESEYAKLGLDVTLLPDKLREEAGKKARATKAEHQRQSYLGRAGRAMEPVFEPLGWDWRIGVAALASFPAREVIVGTMAILYEVEDDEGDVHRDGLVTAIRDDWKGSDSARGRHPIPVALSVMVFFALCCQCASTLAVIRRETRSLLWPTFTFFYMTALAYGGAFAAFQLGRLIWSGSP
jgi:ferrous iron transport protein B